MDSRELQAALHDNTRLYQDKLQRCESRCAEIGAEEIGCEQRIAALLAQIAELQLEQMEFSGAGVARELEFRAVEEQMLRDELAAVDGEIAGHLAAMRELAAEARAGKGRDSAFVTGHQDFVASTRELEQAQADLAANAITRREQQAEIDAKLPQYRSDDFYVFLREVGYGSEAYDRSGAARMMDDWISGLCNFRENYANERTLLAMQAELQARAERDAQRVEEARQALARLADIANAETGAELIARRMAPLEAAIAQAESRAARINASLAEYAGKRDQRYVKAQQMLSASLKAQPIDALVTQARRTPGAEDDRLVLQLITLQESLRTAQRSYAQARTAWRHAEADAVRARELADDLQQGGYAVPGQYAFGGGFELYPLLGRYMNGELTRGAAVREIQRFARALRPASGYSETAWGNNPAP